MSNNKKTNLSKIIDTKHIYRIDDIFENERIIKVINRFNHTDLSCDQCIIDNIEEDTISFYMKNSDDKYVGRITIKYKRGKRLPNIILLGFFVFIFVCLIAIFLPCSIMFTNHILLYSGLTIFGLDIIGIIVVIVTWPSHIKKKLKM